MLWRSAHFWKAAAYSSAAIVSVTPSNLLLEGLSGQRLSCQGNLHSGEEPEVGRGEIKALGRVLKHLYAFAGQKIGNTIFQVHTAAIVADFLAGKSVQMLEHPP